MQSLISVRNSNKTLLKCYVINPFQANVSFPYFPPTSQKKHQKFKGFLIFSGGIVGIEMERWLEMSYIRGNG